MINSKYFFLMIFISASTFAFAQDDEDEMDGRMMLSIGAGGMDFNSLNAVLGPNGYPTLENVGWDWGINLWWSWERLNVIYDFGSHSRQAGSGTTTRYDAGDFTLNFGYGLVKGQHLSLVPYLGLGFDYGSLELVQKEDPSITTVSGYIGSAPYSQDMDVWGFLGSAGLYALWDFSSKSDEAAFSLGFHAGYTPRLAPQKWRSAGGSKLDGINIERGWSTNLVLGVTF